MLLRQTRGDPLLQANLDRSECRERRGIVASSLLQDLLSRSPIHQPPPCRSAVEKHAGSATLELTLGEALTSESFSRCNRDLASQIKRAASSVALNLAEGRRRSGGDRLQAWRVAAGSNDECRVALKVAIGWGWIAEADVAEALALHDRLAAMLHRMTRR